MYCPYYICYSDSQMSNKTGFDMESALGNEYSSGDRVIIWIYFFGMLIVGLITAFATGFLLFLGLFDWEESLEDYFYFVIGVTVFSLCFVVCIAFVIFVPSIDKDDGIRYHVVFNLSVLDSKEKTIHLSDIHDIVANNYLLKRRESIKSINSNSRSFQTDTQQPSSSFGSSPLVFTVNHKRSVLPVGSFLLISGSSIGKQHFTFYSRDSSFWTPLKRTLEMAGYSINIVSKNLIHTTSL